MNRFVAMLQTNLLERTILVGAQTNFSIMMCLDSYKQQFTVAFFPLNKNQSQISKLLIFDKH